MMAFGKERTFCLHQTLKLFSNDKGFNYFQVPELVLMIKQNCNCVFSML